MELLTTIKYSFPLGETIFNEEVFYEKVFGEISNNGFLSVLGQRNFEESKRSRTKRNFIDCFNGIKDLYIFFFSFPHLSKGKTKLYSLYIAPG